MHPTTTNDTVLTSKEPIRRFQRIHSLGQQRALASTALKSDIAIQRYSDTGTGTWNWNRNRA